MLDWGEAGLIIIFLSGCLFWSWVMLRAADIEEPTP